MTVINQTLIFMGLELCKDMSALKRNFLNQSFNAQLKKVSQFLETFEFIRPDVSYVLQLLENSRGLVSLEYLESLVFVIISYLDQQ